MRIPKGFIKDSNGVYRRGRYILHEGHIIREATLLPNNESKEDIYQKEFDTLEACINAVLAYSSDIGEAPRINNLYIKKSGDTYKVSETESKDDEAIITPDNNVYTLNMTEVINSEDTEALKSTDEDNAKAPKEEKELPSEPKELDESEDKEFIKTAKTTNGQLFNIYKTKDGKYLDDNNVELSQDELIEYGITDESFTNGKVKQVKESSITYTKEVRTKDGKESVMFTDDISDYSAILQFINDYVDGYSADDVEVIHYDQPVTTDTSESLNEDDTEESPETNENKTDTSNIKPLSSTYFIRRPNNIDELRDKVEKHLVTPATYAVVDEIELSQNEFDDYANNLRKDMPFLKTFRPEPTDADFTCIAVKAPDGTTLLIDNSGYDSAQYVGII